MTSPPRAITIDPPIPFIVPPDTPLHLILVGAGGTGSHILQSLARIAAHLGPQAPLITVIDGDQVEMKNVGRQLFSRSDLGQNKAQALAARFSSLFGLRIQAMPVMATIEILGALCARPRTTTVLVGAVDTPDARMVLHEAIKRRYARLWIDCGNEEFTGQVVVGTTANPHALAGSLAMGMCRDLPAPSLVYPDLITAQPQAPRGDCAAQMEANVQGLMINQAVAAIAAQYMHDLIIHRRLTTFETVISLAPITMRSRRITVAEIAAASGVSEDALRHLPKA